MSWNKESAISWARLHAHQHSQHRCAHYVTEAIRHGGVRLPNTPLAKDMGYTLTSHGFQEVYGEPQKGDIAVIQALSSDHPAGHVCIYGGQGIWYSDFVQRSMYPGPGYRAARPSFKLYRRGL